MCHCVLKRVMSSPAPAVLSSLGLLRPSVGEQMRAAQPDLQAASDCLDAILSEQDGRCAALVQVGGQGRWQGG